MSEAMIPEATISEAATKFLSGWIRSQKLQAPLMKDAPVFLRNLEEALDLRRADLGLFTRIQSAWKQGHAYDFCSTDMLSLSRNGVIRRAFLDELARHPDFRMHSGGSRLMDGNNVFMEQVETEIAAFHGAETALIVGGGGYEANTAIYTAIPRPGDAIVYDELVHASTLEVMVNSLAQCRKVFRHNDVEALKDVIASVLDTQPQIVDGSRSLLISVESVYSMDGDVCPLVEMLEVANEMCPKGNAVFIVDEAHATGIVGPNGAGLVCQLGLEKQIAVRMHTCGKALGCMGAVILGHDAVRTTIINFAKCVVYTTAPSFPTVAGIRAAYKLMANGETRQYQDKVQHIVRHFFKTLESNPHFSRAVDEGILDIPLLEDWEDRTFQTHIVPLKSRHSYVWWLFFHLQLSGISAIPVAYPTVPRGQSRIRLLFHAANTEEQVEYLVRTICDWAAEIMELGAQPAGGKEKIPKAAQKVYALMASHAG